MSDCLNIIIFLLYNNMANFENLRINIPQYMLDGIQNMRDDATASKAYIVMRAHIISEIKKRVRDDNNGASAFNIANDWFDLIINSCDVEQSNTQKQSNSQTSLVGGQTRRKKNKVLNKTRKK
jgi:hypothetical protein